MNGIFFHTLNVARCEKVRFYCSQLREHGNDRKSSEWKLISIQNSIKAVQNSYAFGRTFKNKDLFKKGSQSDKKCFVKTISLQLQGTKYGHFYKLVESLSPRLLKHLTTLQSQGDSFFLRSIDSSRSTHSHWRVRPLVLLRFGLLSKNSERH